MKNIVLMISLILTLTCGAVFAQTTEFSYQGSLKNGANPASGNYDFEFALFDAGGGLISSTISKNNVAVANGIFSVKLNFGNLFPGGERFLEIRVRQTGGGAFTTLTPRQAMTSSPYSITSLNATNATQLGGLSSSGFIQNSTSPQASSNFNISGTGTANRISSTGNADFLGSVHIGSNFTPAFKLQVSDSSNMGLRVATSAFGGTVASFGGRGIFQIDKENEAGGRLTILETSGNVGIGITNPSEKLSVSGTIQSTSGGFKFPDGTVQTTAANTTPANTIYTKRRTSTDPQIGIVGGNGTGGQSNIMQMNVPTGTYLISITVELRNDTFIVFGENNRRLHCQLSDDNTYSLDIAGASRMTTTFQGISTVTTSPNLTISCYHSGALNDPVVATAIRMTAVKVEGNVIVQ